MKTSIGILITITALVIGLAAGWFASARYYHHWMENYMKVSTDVELGGRYRVLSDLRLGDTNHAMKYLERQVDEDILALNAFLRDMPADKDRSADIKILAEVREYRAAYPWTSGPTIAKGVADAFALVNTNR